MNSGLILLDKPQGMTSFSAVSRVRRITGAKKAGHTGTLDPMATGVLAVMTDAATRFIDFLPSHDKAYVARVRLGITTDTLDIEGSVLTESAVSATAADFEAALCRFRGEIFQLPPMYSAIKTGGEKLYNLARRGIEIEREKRKVTVHSLELLSANEEEHTFTVSVSCSAGTYVRSLAADIGEVLGCGAVLTGLRRTRANGFSIENAVTLENLEEMKENGTLDAAVLPIKDVFACYPSITVTPAQARRFSNGGGLMLERLGKIGDGKFVGVLSPENVFLGLAKKDEEKQELAAVKVMPYNTTEV